MVYIPLLLVKGPQENCLKSSFIWCQIFQLQTIEKYNRYSTFIIYYNKLSKSSRLKLIGRHCVSADFLPNTLTKKIYIYIYMYIYIYIIWYMHSGGVFSGQVYSACPWTWQEMRPGLFQKHAVCNGILICFLLVRSLALLTFNFFSLLFFNFYVGNFITMIL